MHFHAFRASLARFIRETSTLVSLTLTFAVPQLVQAQMPGGFLEQPLALTTAVEPLLSQSEIQSFLPQRGKFTFPAPYNTQGIRLTNASDCGGRDCVNAVGYSYWRNINNHVGQDSMLIIVGLDQMRGGPGLTLLQYDKTTDAVNNLGLVFPANSPFSGGSGEGWYFSATQPTKMFLNSGSKILRYDVMSKQMDTVFDVDTSTLGSGHLVWQMHTSNDDRVHSATVKNSSGASLGCMAYETDTREFHYFKAVGDYDECQIDKSGKWLVIKENVDGAEGEDNRIINLDTGNERLLRDSDGAGGHSDLGYGYMIAADNWADNSNTQRVWDFNAPTLDGEIAYANRDWNTGAPSHVSHTNARNASVDSQYACGSSANRRNSAEANEVICFRLDGSGNVLVVAPVMTDLDSRAADDYDNSPKGNLDVTGQYFIWTSNMGGSRLDAFLVKVPAHLLTGGSAVAPAPAPSQPAPAAPTTAQSTPTPAPSAPAPITTAAGTSAVVWVDTVNVAVSGGSLQKSGGCDGCIDGGAASQQVIDGNGYLEFTANVENGLRGIGLNDTNTGTGGAEIEFGLKLQGSYAEVRENGMYRFDTAFASGDVFRVAVTNGAVTYAKNGTVFYTSTGRAATAMHADTIFASTGSRINNVVMTAGTGSSGASTTTSSTTTTTSTGVQAVAWTNLVNAAIGNGSVQKSAGCDGCPDAGAVSSAQIASGNGYLEFKGTVEDKLRVVGLTGTNSTTSDADIRYGLRLQNGIAEVREGGTYRWDMAFDAGDTFRIAVENGVVKYLKNGVVFYSSMVAPSYPLRADVSFASTGGTIMNAVMKTGG